MYRAKSTTKKFGKDVQMTKEPFVLPDIKGPRKQSGSGFREKTTPNNIPSDIRRCASKLESHPSVSSLRNEVKEAHAKYF